MKINLVPKQTWQSMWSHEMLTEHQRNSIGASKKLTKYALPIPVGAAGPRNFKSSELVSFPKMEPARAGANDFLAIKNIGIEST